MPSFHGNCPCLPHAAILAGLFFYNDSTTRFANKAFNFNGFVGNSDGSNGTFRGDWSKTTTFSSFIFDFARQIKSVPDIFLGFIFHAADLQPLKSNAGIQDCDRHGVIDGSYRRLVFEPGRHFWVLT